MSNKNPFEIRAEILAMAKEYLDKQYEINVEFANRAFDEAIKVGKTTAADWLQFAPKMYTIDELMKKAQELYGFVNTK